jgi:hypothetical protein
VIACSVDVAVTVVGPATPTETTDSVLAATVEFEGTTAATGELPTGGIVACSRVQLDSDG